MNNTLCEPMRIRTLKAEVDALNDTNIEARRLVNLLIEAMGIQQENMKMGAELLDKQPDFIDVIANIKEVGSESISMLNKILEFIG